MTDRPVLFSGQMVRANHAGLKNQTRRVLKRPSWAAPIIDAEQDADGVWGMPSKNGCWSPLPIPQIGDRLWVREAWRSTIAYDDLAPRDMGGEEPIRYEADGHWETWGWTDHGRTGRHRQGMHMPRWASRTTLVVIDVRVQRVQEISEADAIAEGCRPYWDNDNPDILYGPNGTAHEMAPLKGPVDDFRNLWDSLNAARGYGWDQNPWVTATTYTVHRCNIDQMS